MNLSKTIVTGHSCLRISNYIDNEYMSNLYKPTVDIVYDIGYSDILDIVIFLSLGISPHTKFIGYSDNLAVISMPPALSL